MIIYILQRIRKLFKSIGKKEEIINDLILYLNFKKNFNNQNFIDHDFSPDTEVEEPIKIAAAITFFYDERKLPTLFKVCKSLDEISNQNEIYIFTNKISTAQQIELKNGLKNNIQIIVINEVLNNRLLPWYHLDLMRKIYDKKDVTHFIYLEDDILIEKSNFRYWVNSRKFLKQINLIPGFVRTELNKKNNEIYAVDFVKKIKLNNLPKITINDNYYLVNNKFPYQGMYLYDRELMKEHLDGPSSNPDCGHGAYDTNYLDRRMINLDLMAKANIGLTYLNYPQGFHNRSVVLYNRKEKKIDNNCQIKHLSNKYSNLNSMFGNVKVKNAIS